MSKPEIWRLDRASYPFSDTTETRFQDLDPLGHINNVAMAALFENGRVRFNRSLGLFKLHKKGERWLIARVEINYVAEGFFPDDVEIASGIGRIGTSSWDIASAGFQNGKCISTSTTTIVFTDKEGAKPISEELREALAANMVIRD